MLAGVALGLSDLVETVQARSQVSARRIDPADSQAPIYERQFAAYRRLGQAMAS
jgi:sugar (pentulose or hexulose) kinase